MDAWFGAVEDLLRRSFDLESGYFIPKSPERQEFRKCGIKYPEEKQGKLRLGIEEALFELPEIPVEKRDRYAIREGYKYFGVYHEMRKLGWILIPHKTRKYFYELHKPNKHHNRKTAQTNTYFLIVSPNEMLHLEYFALIPEGKLVFGVAVGGSFGGPPNASFSFALLEARVFSSGTGLLSSYTPSAKPGEC